MAIKITAPKPPTWGPAPAPAAPDAATTRWSSDLVGGARTKKEQEGNTHGRSSVEYRARRSPWRRNALGGRPGSPARRGCGRWRVSAARSGEPQPAAHLHLGELRL